MNRNIKLVIGFFVFITILFVLLLVVNPTNKGTTNNTSPTPIATPTPVGKNEISRQNLLQYLPIQTEEFNIEYLSYGDVIVVTLKKAPVEKSRQDSEKWFSDKGITDFSKYNIQWLEAPELKENPPYFR